MSSPWFGCQKCPFHFATMELALNHLLQSPNHNAEILDLVGQYNAEYLAVAARSMLFSFTKNTAAEHEASVAQADVGSLPRTSSNTPSAPKKELTRHARPVGGDHHTIRGKRRRLVGSSSRIDNSSRTQTVFNCTKMITIFAGPPTATPMPSNFSSAPHGVAVEPPHVPIAVPNAAVVPSNVPIAVHNVALVPPTVPCDMPDVAVEPIKLRVKVTHGPPRPADLFTFSFLPGTHTTVVKLLFGVAAAYSDQDVDLLRLGARRLVMQFSHRGEPMMEGTITKDEDMVRYNEVRGTGWSGQLEIG